MIFEFGNFQIDVDVEATREYYSTHGVTVLEDCGCINCRNYYAAMSQASDKIQEFFQSLGLDPLKTPEATFWAIREDGLAYYDIYFHLIGTLVKTVDIYEHHDDGGETWRLDVFHEIDENFKIGFCNKRSFVGKKFPEPCVQLEIYAHLPWVLD